MPDVTSLDQDTAVATLEDSGFEANVAEEDTPIRHSTASSSRRIPPAGAGRARHGGDDRGGPVRPARGHDRTARGEPAAEVRVAVLMGGRSSEHEISVASARSVLAELDPERYEAVTVEIGRDGAWALGGAGAARARAGGVAETLPVPTRGEPVGETLADVDVVLPMLHGPFGEDGTVQGLLELAGVPYVGRRRAASALCMDRDLFKAVLRDRGIAVARHHAIRLGDALENPFDYPVFVKPARLGSSVGITKVHDESELAPAVELARRHDEKVLVEEFVDGVEVEVRRPRQPATGADRVGRRRDRPRSRVVRLRGQVRRGRLRHHRPGAHPRRGRERVQEVAVEAFVATECEGMARVDFFVREGGEVVVNEINTIPGFTSTSVYAKLFAASGIPYRELLDRLVELALERHERRRGLEY